MTLDKVLNQGQDRGSTCTDYSAGNDSDTEIHTEDDKKKKSLQQQRTETSFLFFHNMNISCFDFIKQSDKQRSLHCGGGCMYARPHMAKKRKTIFNHSIHLVGPLSRWVWPLCPHNKTSIHSFQGPFLYKTLKACKTLVTATAFCFPNLVSELGEKNDHISNSFNWTFIHWSYL